MKKNIGLVLALYPTTLTVIGAMKNDKPTRTFLCKENKELKKEMK